LSVDNNQLAAVGLKKSFKGRCVVNGVSFSVNAGEVVGLLGPNGAGKTTSFHMVVGLLHPESGQVWLCGREFSKWPMYRRARAGLGYLSQEPSVFRKLSVVDNLLLYLEAVGIKGAPARERADQAIAEYDLGKVAAAQATTLSGGERRRLEIARAMIQSPRFLLLDEPFSGIDPLTVDEIQRQIKKLSAAGIGVLITDHNVRETLSICHRAYIVKDGTIIEEGSPTAIATSEKARSLYLGERFRLNEAASP
jgi:ABC-type (unclassified) transport system, ATPase component